MKFTRLKKNRSRAAGVATVVAALLCGAPADAIAGDELPSGERVMDAYVKSTGGKPAYERIKNRVRRITMETPQGPLTMTMSEAPPNKSYVEIETSMGIMKRGTNGDVVWMETPMGAQLVTGAERDREIQDARFQAEIEWRKIYTKADCQEVTEYSGEKCHKVVLTPKAGKPETRYYAVDTGLLLAAKRIIDNPMAGEMEITIEFQDYKEVDGVLYPHKIVRSAGGQGGALMVESIEHNVDMPEDRFALPESVAELVAAQKDANPAGEERKDADTDE